MSPEEESDEKKRRHQRVSVPLLVQYRFGALEEPHFDYALNVSQSGLFIATSVEKPAGTKVFIQVTTRDGVHFLQGEGEVVRSQEGGSAIELTGFDAEARAVLDELVHKAIEDAAPPAARGGTRHGGSLDRS